MSGGLKIDLKQNQARQASDPSEVPSKKQVKTSVACSSLRRNNEILSIFGAMLREEDKGLIHSTFKAREHVKTFVHKTAM